MNRNVLISAAVFVGLVGLCVAARLLPHAPNFTPLAAAALFAGFYFRRVWVAALVPLLAMSIADARLGWHLPGVMAAVYACLLLPLVWRRLLRSHLTPLRVGGAAVASGVAFFLITNLAHWWFGTWFEHTAAGLWQCYLVALPFLKYTLAGDLAWAGLLFGGYALAAHYGMAGHTIIGRGEIRGEVEPAR